MRLPPLAQTLERIADTAQMSSIEVNWLKNCDITASKRRIDDPPGSEGVYAQGTPGHAQSYIRLRGHRDHRAVAVWSAASSESLEDTDPKALDTTQRTFIDYRGIQALLTEHRHGGSDFVPVPRECFLGKEAIHRVRTHFDPRATKDASEYGGLPTMAIDGGPLTLARDDRGNAVALTTTINTGFGSRFVAGQTGIILNNEMDDFVAQSGVPNTLGRYRCQCHRPKKTSFSMSPTILR